MKVFIISLKRSLDRRTRLIKHLNSRGVDFEIFDAIDGKELSEEEYTKCCDLDIINDNPDWLTKGVIGCSLSHLNIYNKIITQNIPYACILEDDVAVDEDFAILLDTIEKEIKKDSLILLYYTSWHNIELIPIKTPLYSQYGLYEMNIQSGLNSSAGYIVTQAISKQLAEFILPIRMGADCWTDFIKGGALKTIYSIYPKPVNIIYAKSTIDYINKKSITSLLSNLIDKYKIFPFYQLLIYRRKKMNKKMNNITILKNNPLIEKSNSIVN